MYKYSKPDNLIDLFNQAVEKFGPNRLFGTKNKKEKKYEWITYKQLSDRVDNLRAALNELGLKKGERVGIIANNRTEWAVTVFATHGLGGEFVPMYEKEILKVWKYIIKDAEIKFLFVANDDVYNEVKDLVNEIDTLKHIFIIDTNNNDLSLKSLEEKGKPLEHKAISPDAYDVANLIYTSGTTGEPKGVLLTHGNIASNAATGPLLFPFLDKNSVSLSILPWAHSYGQSAEFYNWFYFGGSIGIMESVDTLGEDLELVKPTFLIAVPRVFSKIYDGIWAKMEETGGIKLKLFKSAVDVAEKRRLLIEQGKSDAILNIKYKLLDKLVFSKLRAKFGNRLEMSLTASALMSKKVSLFFRNMGILVFDCYGLSETSPAVTMNCPRAYKQDSVGKAIKDVEIRIDYTGLNHKDKGGEIQIKGPNIMKGYFNKPEATKAVFTEDGWFKTGDRGKLDEEGFLYITGRIKEQYKLENGKYVFPASIERDIKHLPYIENAMIHGEGKAYNTCIVVADCVVIQKLSETLEIKTSIDKLINSPIVQDFISKEIIKSLKGKYGGYEIPKKFIFTNIPFSVENGMLTQTLKLKRRKVYEKYGFQLEELYK